jgi:hypothetical protein
MSERDQQVEEQQSRPGVIPIDQSRHRLIERLTWKERRSPQAHLARDFESVEGRLNTIAKSDMSTAPSVLRCRRRRRQNQTVRVPSISRGDEAHRAIGAEHNMYFASGDVLKRR